jgi:hypothetical protein
MNRLTRYPREVRAGSSDGATPGEGLRVVMLTVTHTTGSVKYTEKTRGYYELTHGPRGKASGQSG